LKQQGAVMLIVALRFGSGNYRAREFCDIWDYRRTGELDSHADTMVLSDNTVLVIHDFGHPVRVHSYDELVAQHKHCKTVTGVLAYDHPSNGETYFLIFHQMV
jgi:hypothetical protein